MKKTVKIYNVLFPLWMLLAFPVMWLVVLPANFIIDSVVLLILMKILKISQELRVKFYKKHIFQIFGIGLLADAVGAAFMLTMVMCELGSMGDEWYITIPALLISSVLIYLFNYHKSFRHFNRDTRLKLALFFTIFTAPYTFLVPSSLLYNF